MPAGGKIKHGKAGTKIHQIWCSMLARCSRSTHPRYASYGGRGIYVCERWLDFNNFYADMGERPSGKSLDRINNDGPYAPWNCRWATPREQNLNTRRCCRITHLGQTLSLQEWSRKTGISERLLACRLNKHGWSIERALTTPPNAPRITSVILTFGGKTQPLSKWAKETGIDACTVHGRLKRGWSVERALTQPVATEFRPRKHAA